jgi:hypothetical protein
MSIYATLWVLKFPRHGDDYPGCEWVEVIGQGVPAHIGSPSPGSGYQDGDPYAAFLPPAVECPAGEPDDAPERLRAVVVVAEGRERKATARSGQEYADPLLVLSGDEYARLTFDQLYLRVCDRLRGDQPKRVAQFWQPDGTVRLMFADGSSRTLPRG